MDGQLTISENFGAIQHEVENMGAVPLIEEKTKRQVKVTEKGKEYKMTLLEFTIKSWYQSWYHK